MYNKSKGYQILKDNNNVNILMKKRFICVVLSNTLDRQTLDMKNLRHNQHTTKQKLFISFVMQCLMFVMSRASQV